MDKFFCRFVLTAILLMISSMASAMITFEVDGIFYYSRYDSTCVVIKDKTDDYAHYSGDVVIPASVTYQDRTYPVVGIDGWAFYGCNELTSVSIPNSVTNIGNGAFHGCTNLTSLSIPSSVTTIGENAFESTGLTSIVLPNSVRSLGQLAFYGCSALESVTLSDSLTTIGEWMFMECYSLKTITIPASVTSIAGGVFTRCIGLESIKVEEGNTVYDSRDNCNAIIHTASNTLLYGCQNTVIPNGVATIENGAFNSQVRLTSITIPNSVTRINDSAFYGCTGLTSINIPGSVRYIGMQAFEGCTNVTSLTLNEGLERIESSAFASCMSITSVVIPSTVTYIGASILGGCSALSSIKVADGNKVYDSREDCNAIIETATNTLMRGCRNSIPSSVTIIDEFAFCYATITAIDIPSGVTDIKCDAFRNCERLASVTIPITVTHIGENVFLNCISLKSIVFPSSVEYVEGYALYGCDSLASITFLKADGMPLFGSQVFSYKPDNVILHVMPGTRSSYESYITSEYNNYQNITIVEDADCSGIENVESGEQYDKYYDAYNLAGQRVQSDKKGLLVKKGRKYLVK